jgi:hypothetical protein
MLQSQVASQPGEVIGPCLLTDRTLLFPFRRSEPAKRTYQLRPRTQVRTAAVSSSWSFGMAGV